MAEEKSYVATEALRKKINEYSERRRATKRNEATDALRFGLGEICAQIAELDNLTEQDVKGLATRIKRRKHATTDDMYRLSHAFLQGDSNITVFANTPGAIQVLIKALTGSTTDERLYAIETLCNLSLGGPYVCEKLASLAGSYLILYLDSKEERLKRTSLWILANIVATGGKGAHAIISMELIPKLFSLYITDQNEEDYHEDAAVILDLIATNQEMLLRPVDVEYLVKNFHHKDPQSTAAEYHLKLIFHFNILVPGIVLSEEQIKYLIRFCLDNLLSSADFDTTPNRMRNLYAIRVLSNLCAIAPQCLNSLHEVCTEIAMGLELIFNKIFALKYPDLNTELLWLVKNLFSSCENTSLFSEFVQKLQIPVGGLAPIATGL